MTTREKAPTILTAAGARKLTARIRDALALADDLLVRAYEGRAWEALGHADWRAFCAAELPELRMLKLRADARRERAVALREVGASIPEIVAATGSSLGAIHRDLSPAPLASDPTPGGGTGQHKVTGHETPGVISPPQPFQMESPPQVSNVDRAVALVAAQGARGLTVRELCHEAGWHHGQSSGALTKAHQRGLIVRSDAYRDRCAAYLRP